MHPEVMDHLSLFLRGIALFLLVLCHLFTHSITLHASFMPDAAMA